MFLAGITVMLEPDPLLRLGGVVATFAIGQFIEGSVLTPKLVGDRIGLHPVMVIFAVAAGGTAIRLLRNPARAARCGGTFRAPPFHVRALPQGTSGGASHRSRTGRFRDRRSRRAIRLEPAAAAPGQTGGLRGLRNVFARRQYDRGFPSRIPLFDSQAAWGRGSGAARASGKTHLLQAVCERAGDQAAYLPLVTTSSPSHQRCYQEWRNRAFVCLDDVDSVAGESGVGAGTVWSCSKQQPRRDRRLSLQRKARKGRWHSRWRTWLAASRCFRRFALTR